MKASVRSTYGSGEVLSMQEIDKPTPKDNEVLIRVYTASANRTDYHVLTGRPFIMRLFTGLFKLKRAVTGSDFAGQIEAIELILLYHPQHFRFTPCLSYTTPRMMRRVGIKKNPTIYFRIISRPYGAVHNISIPFYQY